MNSLPDMSSIRKTGFTPEADSGAVHDAPRVQQLSQTLRRSQFLGGLRTQRARGENDDDDESEEEEELLPKPERWTLYHTYRKTGHSASKALGYMRAEPEERAEILAYEAQQAAIAARQETMSWLDDNALPSTYGIKNINDLDKSLWSWILEIASQNLKTDALVLPVHPYIRFNRNSINLVIGKRGSGKTFFILREIIKLAQLDERKNNFNYTALYYISDKQSDDTVNIFRPLFDNRLYFKWLPTEKALKLIEDIEAFTAKISNPNYHLPDKLNRFYSAEIARNPGTYPQGLTADSVEFARIKMNAQDLPADVVPNTLIIFDDCIGLFKKDGDLPRKLYQNRQSRITAFLALQDVHGLSSSMKSNVNSLLLFGGFSRQKWNSLIYQLPSIDPFDYYQYSKLGEKDSVWFDFETDEPTRRIMIVKRDKTEDETQAEQTISAIRTREQQITSGY